MKKRMLEEFSKVFMKDRDVKVYFAPGRVNLIGEHTDYNGGHVFPCALTIGTYAAVREREDMIVNFYSLNFKEDGIISVDIEKPLVNDPKDKWTNYPKGIIWALREKGYEISHGMDIVYYGTIPNGSGLSSSASIEVLTGYILKEMFGLLISNQDIALIGQFSENHFNMVNCGIMDQFAIAMGRKDHAIFLDTASLSYQYAPIKLEDCRIVILNTNKKRGLGDSKYNERRAECEMALSELKTVVNIASLGELTEEQFETYKYAIKDPVRVKRARHAVYENQRTVNAVKALQSNNLEMFGTLMIASHDSLRDDYEVTGVELDTLVEAALNQPGVIGARMTGAGFGGCAVSIVKKEAVDGMIESVRKEYVDKIGYEPDFYVVDIGDGPCQL